MSVRSTQDFLNVWNGSGLTLHWRIELWAERIEAHLKQIALSRMLEEEHIYSPPQDIRLFADDLGVPYLHELSSAEILKTLGKLFEGWRFSYETFSSNDENGEREVVDCLLMQRN